MPYKNNEAELASHRKSYRRRKEKVLIKNKAWRLAHPEKFATYARKWREKNKQKHREAVRRWREKNRAKINLAQKLWQRRRAQDPVYRAHRAARANAYRSIRMAILRNPSEKRRKKIAAILGCSIENFRSWIEARFKPGMSWKNYGLWHIDHRAPLAWAKDLDGIIKCCHFTNLAPLWAKENMSKGARWAD